MYLGIDLGTSSVKLVLINGEQEVIVQHSQALTVSQPQPLWSEQNPEDWWQAACQGMQALKQMYPLEIAAIKAIGLSGQQHGATLLDNHNKVLRPAILWNDGRAMTECQQLAAAAPDYAIITGNQIMPGFTAPKILWVAQHEPALFKQLAKVLLPKDYLRLRMSGEHATDVSDAAGTCWLNVRERRWSERMLAATGLSETQLPKLYEGSEITGAIMPAIAQQWGVSPRAVIVAGGGDNATGAISVNVIKTGEAYLALGTSGVYFVASDQYQANPQGGIHSFCHCLPQRWYHTSVHLSAASCLSWLAATFAAPVESLLQEAEANSVRQTPVIFLPYLSGERTPHNDPYARGVFFGLNASTTRADLTQAVLEGVAFAFADGQENMVQAGITIKEVSVVGGGAQSLYWGKILATVLQRPLIYRSNREVGSALGAARLAWLAVHKTEPKTAFATPAIEKIIAPDSQRYEYYSRKRAAFKKIYRQLKDTFAEFIF